MPQMRMKLDRIPVGGRTRARNSLIDVDDETAHALAHLGIAEREDQQTEKHAVVTAEASFAAQPITRIATKRINKKARK